ncbi:MAG: Gfo/Idh/MocA family oxidoreductase [Carnobacterium sp.]|uniref:Gfo/Idh/MocA family protein n=1 Tax=Carnobacterium sp. TaxID=48221 RepID=UPI0033160265
MIKEGKIGEVIQVTEFGPHQLDKEIRPDWFLRKEQDGGILCDIGSHQIEQFLYYTDNENGAAFIFEVDCFITDGLNIFLKLKSCV